MNAYFVIGTEGGTNTLALTQVYDVPANTGVLLEGAAGDYNIPVVASSSTDVSSNKLVGVTADTQIAAEAGYVLMNETAGVGFYKNTNAFTVGANTAYLPSDFDGSAARPAFFSFGDETTGINEELRMKNEEFATAPVYNLNGQRVDNAQFTMHNAQLKKGVYIVNGKKYIVK